MMESTYTPDAEATSVYTAGTFTVLTDAAAATVDPDRLPIRMPAVVSNDQLYYWSYAWQEAERKAIADLRAGRARTFDDPTKAARYLLGSDR